MKADNKSKNEKISGKQFRSPEVIMMSLTRRHRLNENKLREVLTAIANIVYYTALTLNRHIQR